MSIPLETEQWLSNSGYRHYCFVSWPHEDALAQVARSIAGEIERQLSLLVTELRSGDPRVFLDSRTIRPGIRWQEFLTDRLCRSLVMVALCADVYYKPYHAYCGLEWAAMEQLGVVRLIGTQFAAIQPILIQRTNSSTATGREHSTYRPIGNRHGELWVSPYAKF